MNNLILDAMNQYARHMRIISSTPKETWATENTIEYEEKSHVLREFGRGTRPVLIVPPMAGHGPELADFDKGQSIVETILGAGDYRVYVIGWKSCPEELKNQDVHDLVTVVADAAMALSLSFKEKPIMVGLCMGGWLTAATIARFPMITDSPPVIAGSPIDAHADRKKSLVLQAADFYPMHFFEAIVECNNGIMPGEAMLFSWKMGHIIDSFFTDYIKIWRACKSEEGARRAQRFRDWWENPQDIAGAWYLWAVKNIFKENNLWEGKCRIQGKRINFQNIEAISIVGSRDDITPIASAHALPGEHHVIKDKGHIGVFMSRSAQPTYHKIFSEL